MLLKIQFIFLVLFLNLPLVFYNLFARSAFLQLLFTIKNIKSKQKSLNTSNWEWVKEVFNSWWASCKISLRNKKQADLLSYAWLHIRQLNFSTWSVLAFLSDFTPDNAFHVSILLTPAVRSISCPRSSPFCCHASALHLNVNEIVLI